MADRNRRWTLLLAGLAIAAMVLLAAGLSSLELLPGSPAPRVSAPEEIEAGSQPALNPNLIQLIVVILGFLSVLFVAFFVFYLLFSADAKKRLLIALGLLLWLLMLYLVSQEGSPPAPQARQAPVSTVAPTLAPSTSLPPGVEVPAIDVTIRPPSWLVWLGAITLALLAVGVVSAIAWLVWSRGRGAPTPLQQLAEEAERALGALQAGGDVNDTIMRCYFQMSEILEQERGIARRRAMTPREFERALQGSGLPREPVALLTRLFEKARYGAAAPAAGDEQQAITCLAAIAEACRSAP